MKLISHKIFLKHKIEDHPENPDRIRLALKKFKYENARNGEKYLEKVHTRRYIDKVRESSAKAGKWCKFLDAGDTYACKDTYEVACYAVGAAVKAAEYALKGERAFALVRPPGHHAHPDWTNGFCIFNNIAIASAVLAEKGKKVLIIDIDMHRGDGTTECVHELNSELGDKLYYFSINQKSVFPGMAFDEGNVRNIYVEADTPEDDYTDLMEGELNQIISFFKPDIVAISAGFDSFETDRKEKENVIGCGLRLTEKTIFKLKELLEGIPYFVVLEGGYTPEAVIEGIEAFTQAAVMRRKTKKNPAITKEKEACRKKK